MLKMIVNSKVYILLREEYMRDGKKIWTAKTDSGRTLEIQDKDLNTIKEKVKKQFAPNQVEFRYP